MYIYNTEMPPLKLAELGRAKAAAVAATTIAPTKC